MRDYGEETKIVWDDGWFGQLGLESTLDLYLKHLLQITAELKRVLKPTGVMFWVHGDCYSSVLGSHRNRTAGFSKTTMVTDDMKPPKPKNISQKCLCLQNYRLILKMIDEQGYILRNTICWKKPNHMPSSVRDRFASSYEPVFMLVKNRSYYFDLDAVRIPQTESSKRRVKYGEGTPKKIDETNMSWGQGRAGFNMMLAHKEMFLNPSGKNPGDVFTIPTQPFPEAHFATFPPALIEPLIKAGCPEEICKKCGKARERIVKSELVGASTKRGGHIVGNGQVQGNVYNIPRENAKRETIGWSDCGCGIGFESGVVLDPFMGAGTTALVALKLNRRFIGFELNSEYCKIAEKRIKHLVNQTRLEDYSPLADNQKK